VLLYWIQHGRVRVVPGISRIDGKTVTFTDGTQREYDTILWATGFHASLPFLDEKLIRRRNGSRSATAAASYRSGWRGSTHRAQCTARPADPGLRCPDQARHPHDRPPRAAGEGGADVQAYLSGLQEADDRIDIVRNIWIDQLSDTERLLDAFEHARPAKGGRRAIGAVTTAHAPAVSRYRPTNVADEAHRPSHSRSRGSGADPGSVGGAHAAA
jgi:hypothetical protein